MMDPMIVRSWRGFTTHDKANTYVQHLLADVVPLLGDIPGYQGMKILRRDNGDEVEFLVLTTWTSMDAVRRFAGDRPEIAVVAAEAQGVLVRWDKHVHHYDVVDSGQQ